MAHSLAAIAALTLFVRDSASVSRAMLKDTPLPTLTPTFEPFQLDECASSDTDADNADPVILKNILNLPSHRHDWWAPPVQPPYNVPQDSPLAGTLLAWAEWDTKALVEQGNVHFNRKQIEELRLRCC